MEYTKLNSFMHTGIQVCNPTRNFIVKPYWHERTIEENKLYEIKRKESKRKHTKQLIIFYSLYFLIIVPLLILLLIGVVFIIDKYITGDLSIVLCMGWGFISAQLSMILWIIIKNKIVNDWY